MKIHCFVAAALAAALPMTLAASPAVAQAGSQFSAADFAALPALEAPQLSPSGNKIVGRIAVRGEQFLGIVPIGEGSPSLIPLGENDLLWIRWVNEDWLVAGVGGDAPFGRSGISYITRAVGIKADGSETVPLLTRSRQVGRYADDVIWVANDGTPRVRMSMQRAEYLREPGFWPEVLEFDVSTGRSKLITDGREGIFSWITDGDGDVRVGIGNIDGKYRAIYRDSDRDGFRDIIDRQVAYREQVTKPDLFLADGTVLSLAEGEDGIRRIYRYDLATMALGEPLYGDEAHDILGYRTNADQTKLLGVRYLNEGPEIRWLDEDLAAIQAEVDGKVTGGAATIVSYSNDYGRVLVHVGAADSPGAYFLYDRASGEMPPIAFDNRTIRLAKLNPVSTIRYAARDGLPIEAVLTLPRGRSENLPLIVMPHGGPFVRDYETYDWWAQFLASRGYAVVQPNYRGSSGYGRAFALAGDGEWGRKMQDDLNDAITHLAGEGIADAGRVCIVGGSYGGYAAMRAAQRDSDLYRCAVSFAGVSDMNRMLAHDKRFLGNNFTDWLSEQAPDLSDISPINFVNDIRIPLLLVHGKEDLRLPESQSREMYERMRAAGKDVTYIEQEEGDHGLSREEDRVEFLEALEAFLAEHNPA
ncbi:alpha/beta hydrolase family protein [Sphingosinithalassobacter sp. CS137]|uniref:alpha/beta hydrolase family protein n=1 Tax=Sphingosinithalassobacter sp. CS137 TaxID=2762748 RepID=UPI00165D7581|nr:S9 family peptidase [Sphingosinithalassobacter sp. CS137]